MFNEENIQDVKGRILRVSADMFVQNGFNGTSIRDIASGADTSVAMVNYYFRSKYELFERIFEEAIDLLTQRIFTIFDSDIPFMELVERWVDSYYEVLMDHPEIPMFVLNEVTLDPTRLTARIKRREPYVLLTKVCGRIEEEIKKGTIRDIPPIDLLLNILSLCIFPFVFGRVATKVADVSQEYYTALLSEHKKQVISFIVAAMKPETTK